MNDKKVASFRERFVELVDSCPKSQTQISQEFGVAKQTISAWYNGKSSPKLPTATSLADYFNVSLGWLLGFDVEKQVNKHALDEYEKYLISSLNKQENLGLLLPEESDLIISYRSLTQRGQALLMERSEELKVLYGKKSESDSAESV